MTRHGTTALGSAGLLFLFQGLVGCGNGDASPADPGARGNDKDPAAVEHPNDAAVYKGKQIFEEVSCDKCHHAKPSAVGTGCDGCHLKNEGHWMEEHSAFAAKQKEVMHQTCRQCHNQKTADGLWECAQSHLGF